jgi:hypothetical protein
MKMRYDMLFHAPMYDKQPLTFRTVVVCVPPPYLMGERKIWGFGESAAATLPSSFFKTFFAVR